MRRPGSLREFVTTVPAARGLTVTLAAAAHSVLTTLQNRTGPAVLPRGFLRLFSCSVACLLHLQVMGRSLPGCPPVCPPNPYFSKGCHHIGDPADKTFSAVLM